MQKPFEQIFAVTPPGLEEVCAAELRDLLGVELTVEAGGVAFAGGLRELYLANLHSRIASRILVRVGMVRSRDFSSLYKRCLKLPWGRFVKPDSRIVVRASSRASRLLHTGRLAETIGAAIDKVVGGGDSCGAEQLVIARMEGDDCLLSVDSSGELLHRRGYRIATAHAPLRETLAAGILRLLGWTGETSLYDPMCGSGTFLVEAALMASGRPPGSDRMFAFMGWPRYRQGLWTLLLDEARRRGTAPKVAIAGSDIDPAAVGAAINNRERAGCSDLVRVDCSPLAKVARPAERGLVICNPPYGLRVGGDDDLPELYRALGALYREVFHGWQGALLCPPGSLVEATGLDLRRVATLKNGGLKVGLYRVEL